MENKKAHAFVTGLWKENPVFAQLLGMCPTLAITNSVINGVSMGLATTFVMVASSFLVSLVRNGVPKQVRIATYVMIIATFVTVVDYIIKAVSVDISKALGPYVALIVVNCIILGRAEAFASRNKPWPSILDAAGSGFGFTLALICMGTIREVLGNGTFLGINLFGSHFQPWVIFVMPCGGFLVLAFLLLGVNVINERTKRHKLEQSKVGCHV